MPFDTLPQPRPYMREGTAALAALVATKPAADVLALVAAELAHRERPAARRLAADVAALLSSVAPVVVPVQPQPEQPAAAPRKAAKPRAAKVAHPERATIARPAADIMRESKRARMKAEKQPPAMMWGWPDGVDGAEQPIGNPMREARKLALEAQGWVPGDDKPDGYMIWRKAGEVLRLGHHGMVYIGLTGWWQMPRADREALTDAGRPLLEARQAAEADRIKRRNARSAAEGQAATACAHMLHARKGTPGYTLDCARAKVALAWQARREARA